MWSGWSPLFRSWCDQVVPDVETENVGSEESLKVGLAGGYETLDHDQSDEADQNRTTAGTPSQVAGVSA